MKKFGKRYGSLIKSYDRTQSFSYQDAVGIVKKNATAKFNESFEVAVKLGL